MGYFDNKEKLIKDALIHTQNMEDEHHADIEFSFDYTTMYGVETCNLNLDNVPKLLLHPEVTVEDKTSVQAILDNADRCVTVLNFASYKTPGGMFMQGSSAQEESLCHASFLYNVLRRCDAYYEWNNNHLNHGQYTNRALFSPMIYFNVDNVEAAVNVVTCAAPNNRYPSSITQEEKDLILENRIKFALEVCTNGTYNWYPHCISNGGILVLGAFGCGVFKNDPKVVASIFKKYIDAGYTNYFNKVIFAIPGGDNYDIFTEILK